MSIREFFQDMTLIEWFIVATIAVMLGVTAWPTVKAHFTVPPPPHGIEWTYEP